MSAPQPHVRQAGRGPSVICLHSNASTSAQWRALMEALSPDFTVFAPDSYGCGNSPEWPSQNEISLSDEVDLIEPVIASAGASFILVGHSYGGAVALKAALRYPERVRALVLYEPTLFSLVEAQGPAPNGVDGIRDAVAAASVALDAGDRHAAARCFIDFWMGAGSFDRMPENRQPPIANSVVNVRRWKHALFTEAAALSEFSRLNMPVLYMLGDQSPESAHAVARILHGALPNIRTMHFTGMGHMAPVTHPGEVIAAIVAFLTRL